MQRPPEPVVKRVIPRKVQVIPFSVQLHKVPDVIHPGALRIRDRDAEPLQNGGQCERICLTYPRFLGKEPQGVVHRVRIVIPVFQTEVIIQKKQLLKVGHVRLDQRKNFGELLLIHRLQRGKLLCRVQINGGKGNDFPGGQLDLIGIPDVKQLGRAVQDRAENILQFILCQTVCLKVQRFLHPPETVPDGSLRLVQAGIGGVRPRSLQPAAVCLFRLRTAHRDRFFPVPEGAFRSGAVRNGAFFSGSPALRPGKGSDPPITGRRSALRLGKSSGCCPIAGGGFGLRFGKEFRSCIAGKPLTFRFGKAAGGGCRSPVFPAQQFPHPGESRQSALRSGKPLRPGGKGKRGAFCQQKHRSKQT